MAHPMNLTNHHLKTLKTTDCDERQLGTQAGINPLETR
jgi:hypothetical protein